MRSISNLLRTGAATIALALPLAATAGVAITFDPTGSGNASALSIGSFDWIVNSALAVNGNPAGGLQGPPTPSRFTVLSQGKLGSVLDVNSNAIPNAIPSTKEFTFVAGFAEQVSGCSGTPCTLAAFTFDGDNTKSNFFEIWVKDIPPGTPADELAGTGYNIGTRILAGVIVDASGSFAIGSCPNGGSTDVLDQFKNNDWPGVTTVCGAGGSKIAVDVNFISPDYFPQYGPDNVANLKIKFNTQNNVPFDTADPSKHFVDYDVNNAPVTVTPNIGAVNGMPGASTLDFEFLADASNSFEVGQTVAGACRVTYGGNDKNGNIDPAKFGSACMKVKGGTNCYTFGGQVGAPTADPTQGGPFGEHTHHQVSGPAGDFVFHAGTHSAPKSTRITASACYDPLACRQAEANAGFKQIDFEGTGTLRSFDATAKAYLEAAAKKNGAPSNYVISTDTVFYFRVDMDDTGEPGNKASSKQADIKACGSFLTADPNLALLDALGDPPLTTYAKCDTCADVYQFLMCWDPVNQTGANCTQQNAIYSVRGFLTGGNIQIHKIVK